MPTSYCVCHVVFVMPQHQGCIFSCELEKFPHPPSKNLEKLPHFCGIFCRTAKKISSFYPFFIWFLPFFYVISSPFAISFPFLLFFLPFFQFVLVFLYFSLQIFPILKSFPNLLKNFPPPGGGLFQENIRPCFKLLRSQELHKIYGS